MWDKRPLGLMNYLMRICVWTDVWKLKLNWFYILVVLYMICRVENVRDVISVMIIILPVSLILLLRLYSNKQKFRFNFMNKLCPTTL